MRQEREFLAHRAVIQAIVGKENSKAVQSAFEDLANAFNPYLENYRAEERSKLQKLLQREVSRGALSVRPTGPVIGKSNVNDLRQKLKADFKDSFKDTSITNSEFKRRRKRK